MRFLLNPFLRKRLYLWRDNIDSSGMAQIVKGLLMSRTITEEIKKLFAKGNLDVFCRSSESAV